MRSLQQRLGAADFGRARQERQHRARLGAQRPRHRVGHLLLDRRALASRPTIARLDRETRGPALSITGASPRSFATRAPSSVADITSSLQIVAQALLRVARERQRRGRHRASARGIRRTARRAMPSSDGSSRISRVNTPSVTTSMRVLRDTLEPKRTRSPTVSPTFSPSVAAMRSAAARAASRRGSSTRIFLFGRPGLVEQHQRHARGLAGARRRDQHGGVAPQRRGQRRQRLVDRECRIENLHRVSSSAKADDPVTTDHSVNSSLRLLDAPLSRGMTPEITRASIPAGRRFHR